VPGGDPSYDLVYVRARPWRGPPRSAALLASDFEFLGLALTLEAARARRRALDRHGITVHIVPVRYREAALGPGEAERHARPGAEPAGSAPSPGPPRLLAEHPMLYLFEVPGAAGGRGGGTPTRVVAVDRSDGHVWTDAEMAAYFSLVGRR
jgi:hypothetical protein